MADERRPATIPTLPHRMNVKENSPPPKQPPPPNPASDVAVVPEIVSPAYDKSIPVPEDPEIDIFTVSPVAVLKMFCGSLEALALVTGDGTPTPPIIIPSHYEFKELQGETSSALKRSDGVPVSHDKSYDSPSAIASDEVESAAFRKTPIGSPVPGTDPSTVIGADAKSSALQQITIARKFYSKKPPPIPLEEYLLRLHHYCPMSTAVFLAASLYIHRMAVIERLLPVSSRNVHRLLLAALRVAMKALEDLSYPHSRFAKVGGVTELELGRLEISFCFLANFELNVSKEMLMEQAASLKIASLHGNPVDLQPRMPLGRRMPRNA
ncbi:MAG: hypothetical protein M1835_000221 [Candelina submexicana]|nr:MAG: hypothetical protein M1835_000221 [Candelina submexicana]